MHFNKWSHLYSGNEQTHILTNEEINFLIEEMNRGDLLQILKAEKGSAAETILSKVNLSKHPPEICYTKSITTVKYDFFTYFSTTLQTYSTAIRDLG